MDYSKKSSSNRFLSKWQLLAVISLSVAILSFVSPQIGQLGHGLRTALPSLTLAWIAISQISPKAFTRAFVRFKPAFLFGFLFIVQAVLRFAYSKDASAGLNSFFLSPLRILCLLFWVAAFAELGQDAVRQLRCWVLFGWCMSLALGLPSLIDNPGIAREIMGGNPLAHENAAEWASSGVGEYNVYTSLAICLAPLIGVVQGARGIVRWVALLLVSLAALATLLSTFTMASVLLILSLTISLSVGVRAGQGASLMRRGLVIFMILATLPFLYRQALLFPETEFIVAKADRLFQGILTKGFESGDETGRADWFVQEMRSFADEPFLGYIPDVTNPPCYGHSSLSNSLVLFGIFGATFWFVALWNIFSVCLRDTCELEKRRFLYISWLSLLLGGILNPIWHYTMTLVALISLTVPARRNEGATYRINE